MKWLWTSKTGRLLIHTPHGVGIGYLGMLCVIVDWRGYMVGFWIGIVIVGVFAYRLIFCAFRFVRWLL